MTLILEKPKHVVSLATSAVIVHHHMTVYTGKKSDDGVADEVSHGKGAQQRVGAWSHDLFVGDPDLRNLLNHRQTADNFIKRETYDWAGPLRLLEAVKLPTFMQQYDERIRQPFAGLLDKFMANYDDKVRNALFKRGSLGKAEDYHSADYVRSRFTLDLNIMDVPSGDFRVSGVTDALLDDCRASFQQQTDRYIKELGQQQLERLLDVMRSLAHCCDLETKVKADGTTQVVRRRLYDSTVEKAIAYCDEFQRFNLAGNPELEAARAALARALDGVNVAALRESDTLRANMKQEMDQILAKF